MLTSPKGHEYKYILQTDRTIKPHEQSHDRYGHFYTYGHEPGKRIWGFVDECGMGLFYEDHKEHIITCLPSQTTNPTNTPNS